jgi:hypothetical protein
MKIQIVILGLIRASSMKLLKNLIVGVLCFQLSGGALLLAQTPILQPNINNPQNQLSVSGFANLRVTGQSADGTEANLVVDYSYDGIGGQSAVAIPLIGKKGQSGIGHWFGADPVTVGQGRGTITIKVRYFNDEPGVPPAFTSDQVHMLLLNRTMSARLSVTPFLKTIKWGNPNTKPNPAQAMPPVAVMNTQQLKQLAEEKRIAEEKARAEALARDAARQKAEAEAKARKEAEGVALAEARAREEARLKAETETKRLAEERRIAEENRLAELKMQEDARLKAEAETKRLAQEKRLAEEKALAEGKAREEARLKAEQEERGRKEAEVRALAEAKGRETARLKAEAEAKRLADLKAEEEARVKAEAETKRLAQEKRVAEAKALAESKARDQARVKAEQEERARKEAEGRALAEAKAREDARLKAEAEAKRLADERRLAEEKRLAEAKAAEEARLKAEAETKRLAEERRLAEEKALSEAKARKEAEDKAYQEALAQAKAEFEAKRLAEEKTRAQQLAASSAPAVRAAPSTRSIEITPGLKTKVTNVDIVNRSLDRSQMTIGVEFDYRDSLPEPLLGVDVTRASNPDVARYFSSQVTELGRSRRNFVLFPVKFQPPATVIDSAGFSTDRVLVYLLEKATSRRYNIFPATMLLVWRAPGAQAAVAKNTNANALEIDDFKQNDPSSGYVSIKYNLLNPAARLRVKVYDSSNPKTASYFSSNVLDIKSGRGLQLIDVRVEPDSKSPSEIIRADTILVEMVDPAQNVVAKVSRETPMVWAKPK